MTNAQKNKAAENKVSFKDDLIAYFKGVKSEWGKVTWSERRQVIFECGVVLFVVFLFTVIVYILDIVFKGLLGLIVR